MAKKATEVGDNGPKIILEKYFVNRSDVVDSLKGAFLTLYKGQTHTKAEWDEIINSRIARPAV